MSAATEAICRDVLGLEQFTIERSHGDLVDRVRTTYGVIYVKSAPAADTLGKLRLEGWAYEQCRRRGVPVPDVLAAADPGAEIDFVVVAEIPGRSLWDKPAVDPQLRLRVVREAGLQLRAIHDVPVPGAGPVVGDPPAGMFTDWCPFARHACEVAIPLLVSSDALPRATAERLLARFEELEPLIHRRVDSRLLHGDLEGGHLYTDGVGLTGIIDFGQMQAGDPVWDLGRFCLWDADAYDALIEGYGTDGLTAEDLEIRVPWYRIAYTLNAADLLVRLGRMDDVREHFGMAGLA